MASSGYTQSPLIWQRRLAHWLWALPVLLVVAWLGIRQVDLYPPEVDEYYSMVNVGFAAESPYSPLQVLESLQRNSPNHTPFYFLLLNLWARLVGEDIAVARVLTVFCGLLSLAVMWRLERDFIAPLAGTFALVVAASNTFFNFYIAQARMYPLLALLAGLTLWLYLRLVIGRGFQPKLRDYLALAAATCALANTHAFSALLFVALGVYHLLHVQKDERWLKIAVSIGAGLLLLAPQLPGLLDAGVARSLQYLGTGRASLLQITNAWLTVTFNGSWLLIVLSAAGWLIALRDRMRNTRALLSIAVYFALALLALAALTDTLDPSKMRLALAGFPVMVLCWSVALFALAARRWWLGLLTLLWIAAGLGFQQLPGWNPYTDGRGLAFRESPWQVVSRWARAEAEPPTISWYWFNDGHLVWGTHLLYPQIDYYFHDRGIEVGTFVSHKRFSWHAPYIALTTPWHWVVYDKALADTNDTTELDALMTELHYRACERLTFGLRGILVKYGWHALDCTHRTATKHENELVDYEFYGAALSPDQMQLLVVDRWLARESAPPPQTNLSLQLLDSDWQRQASIDLPLETRPGLSQFAIDVGAVPAGEYRLMAVIYDSQTMLRSDWQDGGESSKMRQLATIVIPE